MGTNYYIKEKNPYPYCEKSFKKIHIGKDSYNYAFALHIIPEMKLNCLDDWKEYWKDKTIISEYNKEISSDEMLSIIINSKDLKRRMICIKNAKYCDYIMDEFC